MSMSELTITKRRLLSGIALAGAVAALSACSDEKSASAEQPVPAVSNETTASTTSAEMPKADRDVDMEAALKPGPLKEMTLGDPNAPVKIIEYMSMTCPHCAHFHETTFDAIKTKYVDSGKAYFVLREFPFPQDTASLAAFMLARCTTEDKFFPFVSMFLKQQRAWAAPDNGDVRSAMLQLSKLGGFTQETFDACLTNAKLAGDVSAVRDRGAQEFGVNSTPTFLINGKAYSGDMSVDSMSALIDSLL
ncbi:MULTISPECIES: DsbA family protein [Rhizobium]|uniref:Disulfide bond formation protein DsbA n=1 Tax=Rhizobium wuzhouense TaxID=1986026 RepID=A0ABX5NVM9_9HYPH|nr:MULTISPECIES: DsbA family protein [Rhizobium]PYB77135.1 disulfide bond formation protein DsbA [Rhizobium wuzhouense]